MEIDAKEAAIVYRAWSKGWCPCCQGDLIDDEDAENTCPVKTIGEGVQICGWCVRRGHDEEDVAPVLLEMLLLGRVSA